MDEPGSKKTKTYNRRDSQMVTHSSTSRPVQCLCMAERTGCPVLTDLWSYVIVERIWALWKKAMAKGILADGLSTINLAALQGTSLRRR
jgi:hypothetical protein